MSVLQQGTVNLASLTVDDIYVVVARPASTSIQGVDTGIAGLVGGASWGPVNTPLLAGTPSEIASNWGPLSVGAHDMPTDALLLMQQGVTKVYGVRVTDGTDAKATVDVVTATSGTVTIGGAVHNGDVVSVTVAGNAVTYTVNATTDNTTALIAAKVASALNANTTFAAGYVATVAAAVITIASLTGAASTLAASVTGAGATVTATASGGTLAAGGTAIVTLTARWTGTEGNNISAMLTVGNNSTTAAPTWNLRVSRAGVAPLAEVFTNLPQATLAASIVSALANGQGPNRPASQLVRASAGAGTGAPVSGPVMLSGGTNGDTGISNADQLGTNAAIPATGMYTLEGLGVQGFGLCGNTDTSIWGAQLAFAKQIGSLVVLAFPAATTTANAVSAKRAAGVDDPSAEVVKDWVYFYDSYNKQLRLVSPMAHTLGRIMSLSPEQSPGNKPINGITDTERTAASQPYGSAELSQLIAAGIKVITNPCPGGSYFGLRHGLNASSDNAVNGTEYTRMTNFLAYSLNGAFGEFIDQLQVAAADDPTREAARVKLVNFLSSLKRSGNRMIDDCSVDMSYGPGKVNTKESVEAGYMMAVVRVKYLNVVRFFVVTLIGGKTVDVTVKAA